MRARHGTPGWASPGRNCMPVLVGLWQVSSVTGTLGPSCGTSQLMTRSVVSPLERRLGFRVCEVGSAPDEPYLPSWSTSPCFWRFCGGPRGSVVIAHVVGGDWLDLPAL